MKASDLFVKALEAEGTDDSRGSLRLVKNFSLLFFSTEDINNSCVHHSPFASNSLSISEAARCGTALSVIRRT